MIICTLYLGIQFLFLFGHLVNGRGLIPECKKSGLGFDYMGKVAVTVSGRTCQPWSAQSPHSHGFTQAADFPDPSMEAVSNYCRNPDDESAGPWCYTTDPSTRWEFCDVPRCSDYPECQDPLPGGEGEAEGIPFCKPPMNCKRTVLGNEYVGTQSQTAMGRACQHWNMQAPHTHAQTDPNQYPGGSIVESANFCRNPDNEPEGPWCYTQDPDIPWEFCSDIQICRDCRVSSTGREYSGSVSVTTGGLPCQRWDSQSPHPHNMTDSDRFPDLDVSSAENYCRNPDNIPGGPWCYTQDPFVQWSYCDIPACNDENYPKVPTVKHVLHIGIDGLKPSCIADAPSGAPNMLKRLGEEGTYTLTRARTSLTTVSSPAWSSHLCSMTPEYTGVTANSWTPPWTGGNPDITPVLGRNIMMPCVMNHLKGMNQNIRTGSFYGWNWLKHMSNRGFPGYVDAEYTGSDADVTADLINYLRNMLKGPTELSYTFMYYLNVDEVGHANGWCGEEYLQEVDEKDKLVGEILDVLDELGMSDEVLIMLSSDHGGLGTGHGRQADSDLLVPMFVRGPGVKKGHQFELEVSVEDIVPTALYALGQKPSPWWRGKPMYEAFEM